MFRYFVLLLPLAGLLLGRCAAADSRNVLRETSVMRYDLIKRKFVHRSCDGNECNGAGVCRVSTTEEKSASNAD